MTTLVRLIVTILSFSALVYSQTRPSGREVINAMVTQYKTLSSYQDAGETIVARAEPRVTVLRNVSFQQPPDAGETLVSFHTYFQRPNLFRFDWKPKRSERESSVWFDGKDVYSWTPSMGARSKTFMLSRSDYLDITVDEAARYSSGSVFPIISMLVAKAATKVTSQHLLIGANGTCKHHGARNRDIHLTGSHS